MKKIALIVALCSFSVFVFSEEQKEVINQKMTRIGKAMEGIFPYIFSRDGFTKEENTKEISRSLSVLYQEMQKSGAHMKDFPITYAISHEAIVEHLKETTRVYKKGNKEFAQVMAKASIHFCMGCHTQDESGRSLFPSVSRSQFETNYQFAEFNFMTRDYTKALVYYDKFLKGAEQLEARYRQQALKRKLTIFAEILDDPDLAVANLSKHLKDESMSKILKAQIKDWISVFNKWKSDKEFSKDKYNFQEIQSFISKYLTHSEEGVLVTTAESMVRFMRLRSILSQYLFAKPKDDEIPQLLYWLSLSERALNESLFYSVGNLYLKQCIMKFPKHPFAHKCYQEYEEQMKFSYSGSAGLNLPDDVKEELENLKKILP